ncbi:hypothetical protein CDAR_476331 [Caerostris darwini]|uniref:Uncharacterized protein n=1 Tax=Caerostris darwini TaxID=1538125 RepID=A0AAV4TKK3_9ARAC|nr:hypothetical protein CDAR_476331 [Caerostris darwini]
MNVLFPNADACVLYLSPKYDASPQKCNIPIPSKQLGPSVSQTISTWSTLFPTFLSSSRYLPLESFCLKEPPLLSENPSGD